MSEQYVDILNRAGEVVGQVLEAEPPENPVPTPTHRTRLTRLEFRNLFTLAEKQALYTAAETDQIVKIIMDDLAAAEYVETTDQTTSDSVGYLASVGVIPAARVTEILAGVSL